MYILVLRSFYSLPRQALAVQVSPSFTHRGHAGALSQDRSGKGVYVDHVGFLVQFQRSEIYVML